MSAPTTPASQLTPFGYALAGALGGVFSNAVVYPLDTVKTRIQAASSEKGKEKRLSVVSLVLRILKEEGPGAFYNGFGASMLNTFSMQYAYFFFYSWVRGSYLKRLASKLPAGSKAPTIGTAMELVLGAVAGALAQIFTIPVSVIATRQQVGLAKQRQSTHSSATAPSSLSQVSSSKPTYSAVADPSTSATPSPDAAESEKIDNTFLGVANKIIREEGVAGLWLGLRASLVLTVNPAITYGVFERVKTIMLLAKEAAGASPKMSSWQSFFVGALSKSLATIVTYPYIMAKVRIQAGTADEAEDELPGPSSAKQKQKKYRTDSAIPLLKRVLQEKGFTGWYQGMNAQITKAVLSQALLFVSKDQFESYALAIMTATNKLTSS